MVHLRAFSDAPLPHRTEVSLIHLECMKSLELPFENGKNSSKVMMGIGQGWKTVVVLVREQG